MKNLSWSKIKRVREVLPSPADFIMGILWFSVLIASLMLYKKADDLGKQFSGPPIAELSSSSGTVQYHPQSLATWFDAETKQKFGEGTVIATGSGSSAEIALIEGTVLNLGANSQVTLTLTTEDGKLKFEIDILRGQVAAKTIAEDDRKATGEINGLSIREAKLALKSGELTAELSPSQQNVLTVDKEPKRNAKFGVGAGSPQLRNSQTNESKKISSISNPHTNPIPLKKNATPPPEKIASTTLPQVPGMSQIGKNIYDDNFASHKKKNPKSKPKEKEEPPKATQLENEIQEKTQDLGVHIAAPSDGAILWTATSIYNTEIAGIPVRWDGSAPRDSDLYLRIKSTDGKKFSLVALSTKDRTLTIPAKKIVELDAVLDKGTIHEHVIKAQLGILPKSKADAKKSDFIWDSKTITWRIISLKDFSDGPILVLLDVVRRKPMPPWHVQEEELNAAAANAVIHLEDQKHLIDISSLISGAGLFRIIPTQRVPDGSGTFIIKKERIIAKVGGKNLSPEIVKKIQKLMNADRVAKGNSSAVVDETGNDPTEGTADNLRVKMDKRLLNDKQMKNLLKSDQSPHLRDKVEVLDQDE